MAMVIGQLKKSFLNKKDKSCVRLQPMIYNPDNDILQDTSRRNDSLRSGEGSVKSAIRRLEVLTGSHQPQLN